MVHQVHKQLQEAGHKSLICQTIFLDRLQITEGKRERTNKNPIVKMEIIVIGHERAIPSQGLSQNAKASAEVPADPEQLVDRFFQARPSKSVASIVERLCGTSHNLSDRVP